MRKPEPPAARPAAPMPEAGHRRAGLLAALGRTVRGLRAAQGLSQQALAARAGLSPRFVAQLEAGDGNISVAKLAEVARALHAPLAALLAADAMGADNGRRAGGGAGDGAGSGGEAEALRREIAAALEARPAGELRALLTTLRGAGPRAAPEAAGGVPTAIALVGLRGAGKSTLGPLLARALKRPFVELDEQIQELSGLAISEIFELHGEGYYREAERHALEHLIERGEPVVLAVSGGAVTDAALFRLLRERTLLVWVKATPEQHMERVVSQGDRRPMANRADAMAELRTLLRARTTYYEQARLVADTSRSTPRACVARLVAELREIGA